MPRELMREWEGYLKGIIEYVKGINEGIYKGIEFLNAWEDSLEFPFDFM